MRRFFFFFLSCGKFTSFLLKQCVTSCGKSSGRRLNFRNGLADAWPGLEMKGIVDMWTTGIFTYSLKNVGRVSGEFFYLAVKVYGFS